MNEKNTVGLSGMAREEKRKSIRLLLLQAWRERWSDVEWGVNLKKILPHGVSGDSCGLSGK